MSLPHDWSVLHDFNSEKSERPAGYFHNKRLTWEGRALAVAKANGKKGKDVRIKATVPGLKAATLTLPSR